MREIEYLDADKQRHSINVLLASPGVGSFTQEIARALEEAHILACYATTIAITSENSCVTRMLGTLGKRRMVNSVPRERLATYPYREFVRLITARFDRSGVLADIVWEWAEAGFDTWVSRSQLKGCTAVYGYEHSCLRTFVKARKEGITTIYDVPSPEHEYVSRLLSDEIAQFEKLDDRYYRRTLRLQRQRSLERRREWEHADIVFANSEFTKASYKEEGFDVEKVCVVPLGAPRPMSDAEKCIGEKPDTGPVRFLYAGTFSIRKGAHYLLDAWKRLGEKNNAILEVVGANTLPKDAMRNLPPSIDFVPSIPHLDMLEKYNDADVLIFPTLCDGFGMVITEAMSRGVPVITTNRAGAAYLITNKENGLLIPAGNAESLADSINWCVSNRIKLKDMGIAAVETVRRWQWDDYRKRIVSELKDAVGRVNNMRASHHKAS